jgi:predicted Fe-Mo cluster-binding NifX family protein
MLIAVPVKFNKEDSPVSPLFGHAKWFAFVKDDKIVIEKNPYNGGLNLVKWLLEKEVEVVITQHMGLKPFAVLVNEGIKCYYPGEGRILVKDAIEALKKGNLEEITQNNIEKFTRE